VRTARLQLSPILLNRWKLETKPRAQYLFFSDFALSISLLVPRILKVLTASAGLLPALLTPVHAQTSTVGASAAAAPLPGPRLLLKAGLRLTHLFYLPDNRGWQLVLPSSLGLEYRLNPQLSLYAQAEADISAGRAQRGRRGTTLPTPTANVSLGARHYFNHSRAASAQAPLDGPWGNYVALEGSAELSQAGRRGGRRRGLGLGATTPAVFALCGMQHGGPTRRLLYDLNAGIGIELPPPYTADSELSRPWDVAAQVNLRVYFVSHSRAARPSGH
jgi:hypothetical protein